MPSGKHQIWRLLSTAAPKACRLLGVALALSLATASTQAGAANFKGQKLNLRDKDGGAALVRVADSDSASIGSFLAGQGAFSWAAGLGGIIASTHKQTTASESDGVGHAPASFFSFSLIKTRALHGAVYSGDPEPHRIKFFRKSRLTQPDVMNSGSESGHYWQAIYRDTNPAGFNWNSGAGIQVTTSTNNDSEQLPSGATEGVTPVYVAEPAALPVPESDIYAFIALGMGLVALVARRQSRRQYEQRLVA